MKDSISDASEPVSDNCCEGSPDIVGAESAAPLLFSIFAEIAAENSKSWLKKPDGHLLCRACSSNDRSESRIVEFWPSRLNYWLVSQGVARPLPEHNPECTGQLSDQSPIVNSPESFGVYKIRSEAPLEHQQILLAASVSPDCSEVHWFIDNDLLMTSAPAERVFYNPTPGKHNVMCVDDQGRSTSVNFTVE